MTRFENGPAAGQVLQLRRSPLYLRVTEYAGKIDALDLLADVPDARETIIAYRKVSDGGTVHVDSRDARTGRRIGQWFSCATYALALEQPDDATLRDTARWQAWALAQVKGKPTEEISP